jgi:hypothetical protein
MPSSASAKGLSRKRGSARVSGTTIGPSPRMAWAQKLCARGTSRSVMPCAALTHWRCASISENEAIAQPVAAAAAATSAS